MTAIRIANCPRLPLGTPLLQDPLRHQHQFSHQANQDMKTNAYPLDFGTRTSLGILAACKVRRALSARGIVTPGGNSTADNLTL